MKFLYPIKKLNIKPWIKYWLLKKTSGSKVLSDLIEGTSPITIENVYEGTTLQELAFKGQTTQTGTPTPSSPVEVKTVTGDNNIVVSNKNLFVATDVFNGYITGNGALVSNVNNRTVILRAKPNTTYTIQAERKGIVISDDFILSVDSNYPSVDSTTAYRVFTTTDTEIERTFTTRATDNWIAFKVANINNSNYEETLATIQLEKGDQATTYTEHQSNSYRVDLGGKNLLNIKDNLRDSASNGITAVYNNDNSITISGQATSNYAYLSNAINCTLPIGTYTLSIDKKLPYRIYINCKYTDNTSGNYIIETNTLTKTFTTSKIIQTVTLIISDIVSGTTYNETIYFQLEEGSQPTEFSPYVANPIELGENDKIWNDEGVWKLNNNEITETNLISQLEAIKNATLFSGTNEITQRASDLPFILNFKYYMKG